MKIKIKQNVRIYINMVLTLSYEKQLKKLTEILIIYFDKYYFILINSKENIIKCKYISCYSVNVQKQPSMGVLQERCSAKT